MRGSYLLAGSLGLTTALFAVRAAPAEACGGLFCNSASPVNQAAERIIFSENGDGTVTAVIEIQYQGPAEKFSWVLPVPGEPEVGISSKVALDRLQAATNPVYMRTTTFAEDCDFGSSTGRTNSLGAPQASSGDSAEHGGVTVLSAGTVGPFDYQIIQVDPELPEPADSAVIWLETEGYDVGELGPELLTPYLENGLNLIAFRLSKNSMTGSIRPIMLTYESELPYIPIRPTAVAANDDMGVLVWVVAAKRAIPKNYKALELNEARIDWFNPAPTYGAVVSAAADESGGQGFVTEFSDDSSTLENIILGTSETEIWQSASASTDAVDLLQETSWLAGWDGYEDAINKTVTLPDGADADDLINCFTCYTQDPTFSADVDALRLELYEKVYKPMADTEALLGSRPKVTRLYTTMSANEMNLDPAFDFNSELGDVSNVHTAEMTVNCDDSWTMKLPQGDTVHGTVNGVWPMSIMTGLPAARVISQLSTQGSGKIVMDNSDRITKVLKQALAAAGNDSAKLGDSGPQLAGGGDDGCRTTGGSSGWSSALLSLFALLSVARRARAGTRRACS